MPYVIRKISGKYRLVEKNSGKIGKNQSGTAMDGGGSKSRSKVEKQRDAINIAYARRHKK